MGLAYPNRGPVASTRVLWEKLSDAFFTLIKDPV